MVPDLEPESNHKQSSWDLVLLGVLDLLLWCSNGSGSGLSSSFTLIS